MSEAGGALVARPWRAPLLVAALIPVAVAGLLQVADRPLGSNPAYLPAFYVLIFAASMLTVVMLSQRYRDGGGPRLLVLSWAYNFSALLVVAHAAAFPGALTEAGLIDASDSTTARLWIAWHLIFPWLLAASLAPWPASLEAWLGRRDRRVRRLWISQACVLVAVVAITTPIVALSDRLPTIVVDGDYSARTTQIGPYFMAVILAAVLVAMVGVLSRRTTGGVEAWALVAVVATASDALVALVASQRFTVGWYSARALAIVAALAVLMALLREVTQLNLRVQRYAERLDAQNEALRDAQALRDHLIAVVSHDMRTPLTGLLGYLEVLRHDSEDMSWEMIDRMHDRCRLLARRLTLLTEDLLAVATLERGDLQVSPFGINVAEELSACAAGFPGLDVVLDCPRDLEVVADSLRLQQALTNLIRNAELYGAQPVRIAARAVDGGVEIAVSDAGPGISTDFEPHLFERYTRGPGTTAQGSGLGLAVVEDLMQAHGGWVRYERDGNAFVLTFPGRVVQRPDEQDTMPAEDGDGVTSEEPDPPRASEPSVV